ncbi:MAG: DUF1653 domain-containing protein [Patescibacteria group bacterium]|nr:DUF1653 domain-containing protein [Patescibacteria group bacterium]
MHVGERYRHYKGNEYEIVALAKHSETLEDLVVYKDVKAMDRTWVRPLAMFLETVEVNGVRVPRFTLIEI